MDVVVVVLVERDWDRTEVLKERQHLVVGRVVGHEEAEIGITQDRGDSDEASATTGDDAHVLVRVLAFLALAVVLVVEVGYGFTEWLDSGGWAILATCNGYVDGVRSLKAALDLCVEINV